ncbi:hypothetical protein HanIR_Chr11g0544521 [Helianthus annuus]|nr:hypothetical protein HanIR_Chr11g0544521 [Helianthus annuus]
MQPSRNPEGRGTLVSSVTSVGLLPTSHFYLIYNVGLLPTSHFYLIKVGGTKGF